MHKFESSPFFEHSAILHSTMNWKALIPSGYWEKDGIFLKGLINLEPVKILASFVPSVQLQLNGYSLAKS